MVFRNVRTGTLLTTDNEDVIEMMTSSPNYEAVEENAKEKPTRKK